MKDKPNDFVDVAFRYGQTLVLAARQSWPPIRDWTKRQLRKMVIAWRRSQRRVDQQRREWAERQLVQGKLPNNETVGNTSTRVIFATKDLTIWGRRLLISGLCVAVFFLFIYDTSIESSSMSTPFGNFGGERIHNLGLQQNRLLGSIAGMIMAAVGAIMIVIDLKMSEKQ